MFKGETNPNAKLTTYQVEKIHEMYASGVSMNKLSLTFNVSRRTIHKIVHGKSWEDLKPVEGITESGEANDPVVSDKLNAVGVETGK